jgi:hypothetical protein
MTMIYPDGAPMAMPVRQEMVPGMMDQSGQVIMPASGPPLGMNVTADPMYMMPPAGAAGGGMTVAR